jgi:hypothetical protein
VIVRERQLLTERIENLKQSITAEFEARDRLDRPTFDHEHLQK